MQRKVGRVKRKARLLTSMLIVLSLSMASFGGAVYAYDEVLAEVSLDSDYYYVGEAEGTLYVTVGLSEGTDEDVSVEYAVSDGSAYGGSDYAVVSGTLVFSSGELSKTIEVPIYDDYDVEGDEDFSVQLSNPSGAVLGVNSNAYVVIADDDYWIPDPPGDLEFEVGDVVVDESGSYVSLAVIRNNGAGGTVTVDYSTSSGSATEDADYGATSGTLVFDEGETWKSIDVPIYEDSDYEVEENFSVSLHNITGGAGYGSITGVNVTIVDNDIWTWHPGELQFESDTYYVNEGDGSGVVYLTVARNNGTDGEVTVNYSTSNGSAISGSDYAVSSGTLTFAPEESYQTIAIPIINDLVVEGEESFQVTLSDPTNEATLGSITTATVTIENDDTAPASELQFSASSYYVIEETGWATLKVVRTGSTAEAVSVHYETLSGTATTGVDFVAASGTLSFGAGETSKTIKVKLLDDKASEQRETFKLKLSNPSSNAVLGVKKAAEVVIYDTDHLSLGH
ncbi:hypothetical protein PAECIP111893_03910 [Paenibacillus plantiphilus]|uniref:Calx-beta domain-containing protein n=1 Tax=Paenibacillus plantiphilus TaxID=2905650 RepID=A0ABM9CK44_9BACL|nr:Calx-beta domain-containing protein [Paenibacillus plantiphilus]CAH1215280.1 hypothetical protein PAECIP111893_03910 [Paenibacillus plantiphilus]